MTSPETPLAIRPDNTVRILLPDLDGDGAPNVEQLAEMLFTLHEWESNPRDGDEPIPAPPAPIGGGVAWEAVERVNALLRPTQGEAAIKAGLTGRLLEGGSSYEFAPLRVVDIPAGDVATLVQLSQLLATPVSNDIETAAEHAGIHTTERGMDLEPADVYRQAHTLAALLTEPWPDDARALADLVAATRPDVDLRMDAAQQATYRTTSVRLNQVLGGDGLQMFLYGI